MTEMQTHIVRLMQEIDDICRRNDIEYFMEGGSVLGAVRHGGFLPWDDDADLAMTRKNWEKFREVFYRENPQNRALECPEINLNYPTTTIRYVDTESTRIWRSLMFDVGACGFAIDIFILEDAPDDDEQLKEMKKDMIDYCEFINPFYRLCSFGDGKRYRRYLRMSRLLGKKRVAEKINSRILSYGNDDTQRYYMRWPAREQVYDKKMFGKPKYMKFEDTELPVPEQTYDYLNYQFGVDWYILPSEENQEIHDTVVDLEISYKDYFDSYLPLINKKQALDDSRKYKEADMKILDYNKEVHRHMYSVAGNAAAHMLHQKVKKLDLDLGALFSARSEQADEMFELLFSDYLIKQLYEWYLFYKVFVPIEDDLLACVLGYLMKKGELKKVDKLINIRSEQDKAMSPKLQTVVESYRVLLKACGVFWEGRRKDAAEMIVSTALGRGMAPVSEAICCFAEIPAENGTDMQLFKEKTEALMQSFPEEDLFKLLYTEVMLLMSNRKSASMLAHELLEKSRHGMVCRLLTTDERYSSLLGSHI